MTVIGRALLFALCVTVEGLYVKPSGSSGSLSLSKQASEVKPALSTAEGADVEQHGILWVRNTGKFCMGLLLTLVAATASWYFERQLARLECLLSIGRAACKSVQEAKAYPENTGCLVHLPGQLKPESPVLDPRFACQKLSTSCVRLRTQVQVFQWMESTETTNSQFQQQWSEDPQSLSLSRRDPAKKTPALPMSVGTTITNAASVKFGSGFLLPQGLLDQFCSFRSAAKLLGSEVSAQNGKMRFLLHSDGRFYWRQGEGWSPEQVAADPMSGDLRVAFDMAPSGVATVLALQADQPDSDGSATLLPYRLVPQVYDQGEHKRFLLQEARKSRVGLVQEDQVCPQSRLCCSCNFVAGCCTGMATPEIFRLFEGHKTVDACFADLRKTSSVDVGLGSWSFRLLVLSVLTAGIYISFSEALVYALPAAKVTETPGTLPRFVVSACAALAATNGIISVVFFPFKVGKAFVYLVAACFFGMLPLILMC